MDIGFRNWDQRDRDGLGSVSDGRPERVQTDEVISRLWPRSLRDVAGSDSLPARIQKGATPQAQSGAGDILIVFGHLSRQQLPQIKDREAGGETGEAETEGLI